MEHPRDIWDFSDPSSSESRFRERLLESVSNEERWVWLTQIARAQGLQKQFDEGFATLASLPEVHDAGERWKAYALLERGRLLNSSGKPDEARPYFERAAEAPDDELRIDALHMLAIVSSPEESLGLNERALSEADASGDFHARRWRASLLNNLGWSYHDLGRFEDALSVFERALAVRVEQDQVEEARIARWCVARCLRSLGRVEESLALQRELEQGPPDRYVFEEIAECLGLLGDASGAEAYRERARALEKAPETV